CDAARSMNSDDNHDSGPGGTEGVVELTQWFERMEIVFRISNYSMENQIKFATRTLLGSALTWWNAHVRTVGHDVAYAITWTNLKKMITNKYCPRGEVKKLEVEMWNLKVKGTDVVSLINVFQELALMVLGCFLKSQKDRDGMSVVASDMRSATLQTSVRIRGLDNKQPSSTTTSQEANVAIAYTAGSSERKEYAGTLSLETSLAMNVESRAIKDDVSELK
ncbi:reverse transcriptase domain-containing protein, partial [Tanacetum coccineum]